MPLPSILRAKRTYADAILALNPVGYWRLGERSGTVARDELGRNHGTYVGSPTLGAVGLLGGDGDSAATFGATQWATLPDALRPTAAFTFSAWVKATAWGADGHILSDYVFSGSWQGAAIWTGATGIPSMSVQGTQISGSALAAGSTHQIVGTHDGTNGRLYVAGALVAGPTAMSAPSAIATLYIGSGFASTFHFVGTTDEAAIFSRALSSSEVADLYRLGAGRS